MSDLPNLTDAEREMWERCEAATPGPWHYELIGEKSNDWGLGAAQRNDGTPPPPGRFETERWRSDLCEYESIGDFVDYVCFKENDESGYANPAFIANARTDLPAALRTIDELRGEVERLREALTFYADTENYCGPAPGRRFLGQYGQTWELDEGEVARRALRGDERGM